MNAGYILSILEKWTDAVRFINTGLIVFEDLDNLLKKNMVDFSEVASALVNNVFLISWMKGDIGKDIDTGVPVKVRTGVISVMIEGYGALADILIKVDRADDANSAHDTALK